MSMVAANRFISSTSSSSRLRSSRGETKAAAAQARANATCSGRIQERRRPKTGEPKRSTSGAQKILSDQGRASAVTRPMAVSDIPASRR